MEAGQIFPPKIAIEFMMRKEDLASDIWSSGSALQSVLEEVEEAKIYFGDLKKGFYICTPQNKGLLSREVHKNSAKKTSKLQPVSITDSQRLKHKNGDIPLSSSNDSTSI